MRWLRAAQCHSMGRILQPRARAGADIPSLLWEQAWTSLAFVRRYGADAQARLRELCGQFLTTKVMTGAGGLQLTGAIQANIALQACIPVLELGIDWYRGWSGIVVYPSEFMVRRQVQDDSGVVHDYGEELSGEAWQGGPVVLSWSQEPPTATTPQFAFNAVIHEFAHKLDQLDGEADGRPPFDRRLHAGLAPRQWNAIRDDAFERFNAAIDLIEAQLPSDLDPESGEAARFYAGLALDPYAAQDHAEFFAVSSESFFVEPARLSDAFPQWYRMLADFYRQDPMKA